MIDSIGNVEEDPLRSGAAVIRWCSRSGRSSGQGREQRSGRVHLPV